MPFYIIRRDALEELSSIEGDTEDQVIASLRQYIMEEIDGGVSWSAPKESFVIIEGRAIEPGIELDITLNN